MWHLKEFVLLSQIKSVIRRTKEIQNVHPMYRDGLIRRKMGPLIFHKSNSQDRLIEELQGKLGIARKDRPKNKQPDDWLTEGVIVMSNPKRSREDHNREVDKVDGKDLRIQHILFLVHSIPVKFFCLIALKFLCNHLLFSSSFLLFISFSLFFFLIGVFL